MDRMKTTLLILGLLLIFSGRVNADEGVYAPVYAATPSASATPDLSLVPTATSQPEITCQLTTKLPRNMQAPVEVHLLASGTVNGSGLTIFRYLFGDGESVIAGREARHVYEKEGSYQVRVTPVVEGDVEVPICKTVINVLAGVDEKGTTVETVAVVIATPLAAATAASVVVEQPKTGISPWYWAVLVGLFGAWLGAVRWYQTHRFEIS